MSSILTQTSLNGLTPREAVADAVLRFVQGLDDGSESMLISAFTKDAVFDLTRAGMTTHNGRDTIVKNMMDTVAGNTDSQHNVTNFRINIDSDGKGADLSACAVAQHYRKGEGNDPKTKQLLMGNKYWARLAYDTEGDGLWRIVRFDLEPRWIDGDFGVLGR